jgi:rhodanese-related sulfurtransferase
MSQRTPSIDAIGPLEAHELIDAGALLIDVREPQEWEAGRAPQAHHIPLGELHARVGEVPSDQTVVFVCHSGGRSGRATQAFRGLGYEAVNLTGGMLAWQEAGLPVVSDTGPGTVD